MATYILAAVNNEKRDYAVNRCCSYEHYFLLPKGRALVFSRVVSASFVHSEAHTIRWDCLNDTGTSLVEETARSLIN